MAMLGLRSKVVTATRSLHHRLQHGCRFLGTDLGTDVASVNTPEWRTQLLNRPLQWNLTGHFQFGSPMYETLVDELPQSRLCICVPKGGFSQLYEVHVCDNTADNIDTPSEPPVAANNNNHHGGGHDINARNESNRDATVVVAEFNIWNKVWAKPPSSSGSQWGVCRVDYNGNNMVVDTFGSEAEAALIRDKFMQRGHHQHYWVEKLAT